MQKINTFQKLWPRCGQPIFSPSTKLILADHLCQFDWFALSKKEIYYGKQRIWIGSFKEVSLQ